MVDRDIPFAVTFHDEESITLSFANPAKLIGTPVWGKECWWTDPPPPHCAPNLCQFSPDLCGGLPGGIEFMSRALSFNSAGQQGLVATPEDLEDFPKHLWPLIKTIENLMKQSKIDLPQDDFSGLTMTFHR